MTPEQVQRYKDTRRCPMCDSTETVTDSREEDWEPYELPEDSTLLVSKRCASCGAEWVDKYAYILADIILDND